MKSAKPYTFPAWAKATGILASCAAVTIFTTGLANASSLPPVGVGYASASATISFTGISDRDPGGSGTAVPPLSASVTGASASVSSTSAGVSLRGSVSTDGTGAYAQFVYYFQAGGGNPGDPVIADIAVRLSAGDDNSGRPHDFWEPYSAYALATVEPANDSDDRLIGGTISAVKSACSPTIPACVGGPSGTSFNGVLQINTLVGITERVDLIISLTGNPAFDGTAEASADPYIYIDASTPNADDYSIIVSSNVVNVLPGATPLPAALPLFGSGLVALGLAGWRRKKKAAVAATA